MRKAAMTLTLASVNLHCGLDRNGRPFPVKQAIAALDADVVLVQENWRVEGSTSLAAAAAADCGYGSVTELDLISGVPLARLDIVDGEVPEETGSFGLAVLSRVPWESVWPLALGAARGDVVGIRSAQVVTFAGLRAVNVHLTHRVLHGPAQLRRLVAGLRGHGIPTLIAGDLNMCRPTVRVAHPYRPAVRGRTWPAHRPMAQLDHVLLGPGLTATHARVGPPVGSDHLPVQLTVAASEGDR
ncbi:hypothetical protein BG844_00115 [Couchioplanes caeruleus subsp. caeruleus]|uniref:Endonuclease/exonuclease/phosphatase domain-containing protein n=3 Tax=Couchioplanes caeruleus TaxID=56438 RepID=A0A1K0FUA1_9ACTN|nr:hypothetical protein BG844_00115 [Couchioplanes caeruleus subsp. caeruleus]